MKIKQKGELRVKALSSVLAAVSFLAGAIHLEASQDHVSKVKLTTQQPFMCAMKHYHIPGTAENQSDVTLSQIQLKGEAYGEGGKLLSVAFGRVFAEALKPGETAAFDVEFLDIVGPDIAKVKDARVEVVSTAPVK